MNIINKLIYPIGRCRAIWKSRGITVVGAGVLLLLLPLCAQASAGSGLRDIGSERQYFFDDGIVETTNNTKRRLNPAVKVADNPVIKRDKPWEGSDIRIAWVIYDHRLEKFRMRYSSRDYRAGGRDEKGEVIVLGTRPEDELTKRAVLCEAFSDDGVHWEKPHLGLVEFAGSKQNNIVPSSAHYGYFFEDLHEADPQRHYKAFVRTRNSRGGMIFNLYYSADAYDWKSYDDNPVIDQGRTPGQWGPTHFLGWDPIRETYAVHMENNRGMMSPNRRREIGRAESLDMIHWSEAETIIVADPQDYPDTEFYAMPTTFHEGWAIGLLWIFSTTNTMHEPEFVFSRDSVNYDRTYREPLIRRGNNGDFDAVSIYANGPIFHNDEVLFYYTGTNWRSPEQLITLGDKATAGIGLARLPMDGFVSLEGARDEFSNVTTRSFHFTGKNLFINMQAALQQWGAEPCEVKVEILDGRHAPIEGYTLDDADTLTNTHLKQLVSWNGKADVSSLEGKAVRLRIHFKNAKLYTFQFE